MRYNKLITFVYEVEGKRNPETGEYDEPTKTETKQRANVTDLGTDRSVKLFGSILEGAKVVRLLRPFNKPWDYVLIDGVPYEITKHRDARLRDGFICREVVKDG